MTPHVAARAIGHRFALDRSSTRSFDQDGRLHVSICNISKAAVNGYLGREIPDFQSLGLDPDRLYQLLRDPNELARAARTFNNLPVLSRHVPVDVGDHQPDLVVGSTGTDAKFTAPYLTNSLVVWTSEAIDGVLSGAKRELSSAYRYRLVLGPGAYDGQRYEGRMVEIVGNHVAIVPEGRVGSDVVIGDAARRRGLSAADAYDLARRYPHAAKIKISA